MPQLKEQCIVVDVVEHRVTHLLVAQSKDMPGLMVAARSIEQLEREIPIAIKEMLEAQGEVVSSVDAVPNETSADFMSRQFTACARFAEPTLVDH